MSYTANTSTTTPHQKSILDALKTTAESDGWTTIEDAYADGTYTRYVFRSPASDFFAVFWYHTSGSTGTSSSTNGLYATVCEDYDVVDHTLIRPAVTQTSVACSATDDSIGTTEISLATVISTYGYVGMGGATSAWNTGRTAYISTFSDGICLLASPAGSMHTGIYVGKFTSLVSNAATNDSKCFVVASLGSASTSYNSPAARPLAGTTRSAMNANDGAHSWRQEILSLVNTTFRTGDPTVSTNTDLYQNGPVFTPLVIARQNRGTDGYLRGGLRGRLTRIVQGDSGGVYGDTYVINGNTYICDGSNNWWQKG